MGEDTRRCLSSPSFGSSSRPFWLSASPAPSFSLFLSWKLHSSPRLLQWWHCGAWRLHLANVSSDQTITSQLNDPNAVLNHKTYLNPPPLTIGTSVPRLCMKFSRGAHSLLRPGALSLLLDMVYLCFKLNRRDSSPIAPEKSDPLWSVVSVLCLGLIGLW